MTTLEVKTYLENKSIRPSLQRMAVMQYLLEHPTHPTVDDIYLGLCKDIPTLSKTTIYNTLKLLVDKGAALCLTIDEKNTRYDGFVHNHAHFKCTKCGEVFDLSLKENIAYHDADQINGFVINDTKVYHNGLCSKCNKLS